MNIIYSNTLHVHNHRLINNFNGRVTTTTTTTSCSRRRASVLARNSSSASTAPELSPSNAPPTPNILISSAGKPEADVIVIGSGIGGLCCAGLLARYEQDVLVLESHDLPGGAAHSFDIKGYKFDSGPSLFSGLQSRGLQANPLAQVLDALGEPIPCVKYDSWKVYVPEGEFLSRIGPTEFFKDLEKYAGPDAVREWRKLLDAILPMSTAAMALPPVSIRGDWGVLSTAAARYAPTLLKSFAQMGPRGALGATKLLRPFSEIVDSLELKDPFIRNWVDLLSFLLAGVKSDGILSAEMAYMFAEWYKPNCTLEYLLQGSGAIVDALVRGVQNFGGRISLRSHVETIVVENGRAIGVKLRTGQFVRARKAVVSNASMWDTLNLLPKEVVPKSYQDRIENIPQCESFMHLHLGFDSEVTWNSVERAIGSGFTREKCEVKLVGTPLTSKRFLRKNRGTYGPAIQAGKDTNANPATKITKNKSNGVPKNEPKITIPTMYDIIASSKQQKVELKLQTLGPFFRITAKRLESDEEIGRADGIIRVWFGGKILHLDSIKLSRETLGMEKSIFGIGVFLGAVAIRYGYDCGCTSAELLAINDSDLYHKKLVRFYTRIGFKKVYEVTGSSVGDYSHMLVWGGVGTRMEANVQHLLVKWCTRFIPRK